MSYINEKSNYTQINADIWSDVNECLTDKSTGISHEAFLQAKNGELKVSLAGVKEVPSEWFPNLRGKDVLGLASGGGDSNALCLQHMAPMSR